MNSRTASIPTEAQRAADRGDLIEAIKITREVSNLGLKDAKDAVEAYLHGHTPAKSGRVEVPLSAVVSLQEGNLIEAIRQTREAGRLQLKESRDIVLAYLEAHPPVREQYEAARKLRGVGWRRFILPLVLVLLAIAVVLQFVKK
jgi:ribosomal protein L7/L12